MVGSAGGVAGYDVGAAGGGGADWVVAVGLVGVVVDGVAVVAKGVAGETVVAVVSAVVFVGTEADAVLFAPAVGVLAAGVGAVDGAASGALVVVDGVVADGTM